jgi:alpha-D-xyloside xylohydrolase
VLLTGSRRHLDCGQPLRRGTATPSRVPAEHRFRGRRAHTEVDDSHATITSGALSVRFARGEQWALDFLADGKVLTTSGSKAMALISTDSDGHYVREQLSLGIGEVVYGLGERFGPLAKNGQVVDIWNADGGTSSEQAYKNVPFYLTNRGYGVFVNHPGLVSFEVGSEAVSRVQFSGAGHALEYRIIYGPTFQEILRKYTALTGRPALPPAWSFGLWLSTSFTTSYDEETVTGFVDGMARRDLPLSVFHFDCFWMREFQWCDFTWDSRTFPDPSAMLSRLKERGLRVCVWINPYIAQRSPLFDEGAQQGYLLRKTQRRRVADRPVASGNGDRGLHESRRPAVVRGQAAGFAGHGRGLFQDRLRGADPHRCGVVRWL